MKKRHAIGIVFGFVLVNFLLFGVVGNWSNLKAFPYIISSFYSKEFCSCYFVVRKDEEFCHHYARQWVPISDFRLDLEEKKVTVSGLGKTNTAYFRDKNLGCVLENFD